MFPARADYFVCVAAAQGEVDSKYVKLVDDVDVLTPQAPHRLWDANREVRHARARNGADRVGCWPPGPLVRGRCPPTLSVGSVCATLAARWGA